MIETVVKPADTTTSPPGLDYFYGFTSTTTAPPPPPPPPSLPAVSLADADGLLTVGEVAAILRVKPSWVYRAVREGTLPAVKLGGGRYVRIDSDDLRRWVAEQKDRADG